MKENQLYHLSFPSCACAFCYSTSQTQETVPHRPKTGSAHCRPFVFLTTATSQRICPATHSIYYSIRCTAEEFASLCMKRLFLCTIFPLYRSHRRSRLPENFRFG